MPTNTKALQVAEPVPSIAGKNFVINGGFDVWQRGTSVTAGDNIYTADRWTTYVDAASNRTVSRQSVSDTTNLPNIQYCARVQRASGNTSTGRYVLGGCIETSSSIPLAGQTVTFSFYARAGANYSVSGSALGVNLQYGTGTDQNIFVGFTGNTNLIATTKTLTTTWQRFSVTGTFPTTATQVGWAFNSVGSPVGTAGAADYYEVTGVQLEIGSVATPFSRAGGTIQGELAACQRYYWRANAFAETSYPILGLGAGNSATQARTILPFPVQMRVKPTTIDYSTVGGFYVFRMDDTQYQATGVSLDTNLSTAYSGWLSWTVASGLTANTVYYVRGNNNSSYYLGFSAEL